MEMLIVPLPETNKLIHLIGSAVESQMTTGAKLSKAHIARNDELHRGIKGFTPTEFRNNSSKS